MARRSDHTREELEALILQCAWDIVGNEGTNALTARNIAKCAGYTPGTIYNVFKSMDEVILHLNARTLDLLYDALSDKVCNAPEKTALENMKCMARHYMNFAQNQNAYWRLLFAQAPTDIQIAGYEEQWYQEKLIKIFAPLEQLLSAYFDDNAAKQRRKTARTLWSAIHGICWLEQTGKIAIIPDSAPPFEIAEYLLENFVAGLSV